jgi:hypothetical protein
MRSIGRQVRSAGRAYAPHGFVLGRAFLEDRDEELVRKVREPVDGVVSWGVAILAIGMAVGYQLLRHAEALLTVARRREEGGNGPG